MSSSKPNVCADRNDASTSMRPEHRRLVLVGLPGPAHRRRAHRPHRRPGEREHARLAVERDHAHHHRAEAVGLAQRDLELRAWSPCVCAAYIRAPLAQDALPLRRAAGHHARVVGQEDERQVERVGDGDEVRGLVGAVGVDGAGQHQRLVRDDRDRVAAEAGERADERRAEVGLHLEARAGVEHDVDHLAHVVDAPAVARDEVEQLGHRAAARRRRRSYSTAGTTTPTTGSSRGSARTRSSAAASSSATLWISPLGERDARPAEVLLGDRPRRATRSTTGGPAVKIDAWRAHHREVGHRRDQRAVAGRRAEHRGDERDAGPSSGPARAGRSGSRAWRSPVGPEPGALEHHDQRHPVGDRDLRDPVALRVRRPR